MDAATCSPLSTCILERQKTSDRHQTSIEHELYLRISLYETVMTLPLRNHIPPGSH